jgi:hypothetical protein
MMMQAKQLNTCRVWFACRFICVGVLECILKRAHVMRIGGMIGMKKHELIDTGPIMQYNTSKNAWATVHKHQ